MGWSKHHPVGLIHHSPLDCYRGYTLFTALRNFPKPPEPGLFSAFHKRIAWIAVLDMVATVVTGLIIYYLGFIC